MSELIIAHVSNEFHTIILISFFIFHKYVYINIFKDRAIYKLPFFKITLLQTGEASASILWENDDWFHFKENTGFTEPKYTSADYIRHVIPKVKVIICVRNPTDRYIYINSTFVTT